MQFLFAISWRSYLSRTDYLHHDLILFALLKLLSGNILVSVCLRGWLMGIALD